MTIQQIERFEDPETIEDPNEYKSELEMIEFIEDQIAEEEGHELSVEHELYD